MSGVSRDLRETFREMIFQETRYLRHYWGEVIDNNDPETKGRVKVKIPELGRTDGREAIWCSPRYRGGIVVPAVGAYVEVYFMNADIERPVYLGEAGEFKSVKLKQYDGPKKRVIFEDSDTGDYITYDARSKEITVESTGNVIIKAGAQATKLELNTGDASTWLPNILQVDPVTGVPHGGPTAGIVKLKGA
jgi:hypothetical protein